jgi:hypothetical protein
MPEYPRYYPLYVQRELRRIGVDLERLGGLAGAGVPSPVDFLHWLRTIPGGIGHDAFLARLHAVAHESAPIAREPEANDVATFVDPDTDEQLAYAVEFDRVVPPATVRERSFGYDWPRGRAHALGILRTLADGAGLDAYLVALRAPERHDV